MINGELFIVWSPTGKTPPRYTFCNYDRAKIAAENMANQHPNQKFIVMRAMISFMTKDPMIVERYAQDDIPF